MKYYLPLAALSFISLFLIPSATFADSIDLSQLPSLTAQITASASPAPSQIPTGTTTVQSAISNASLVSTASERESLMLQAAQSDRTTFFDNAISADTRAQLPASVQANVEQEVTVSGTVAFLEVDDFAHSTSTSKYQILTSDGHVLDYYPIYTDVAPAPNSTITVTGYKLGNVLVADPATATDQSSSVNSTDPIITTADTTGTQQILVIPLKFNSTTDTLPTPATIANAYNTGPFGDFYKTQSSGKLTFKTKVLPWVTITSASPGCESVWLTSPEITQALSNAGINLSQYRNVVFLTDANDWGGGCSIVGKTSLLYNGQFYTLGVSWYGAEPNFAKTMDTSYSFPWNASFSVAAHEVGHTLGLTHANALDCRDSLYKNCSFLEYGNYYDVMGFTGDFTQDFNAYYRQQLGWASATTTLNINKSGTYTLNTFEGSTGNVFATIQNPALTTLGSDDTPYYLEFRQPIGYDQPSTFYKSSVKFDGALINKIAPASPTPYTELIDPSPTKNIDWYEDVQDAGLTSKTTLSDPANGITLKGVSTKIASSSASSTTTFTVTLGTPICQTSAPSVASSSYAGPSSVQQGNGLQFTILAKDVSYDGCGKTTFSMKAQLPDGLTWTKNASSTVAVIPDGSAQLVGQISTSSSTPAGTYPYTLIVTDNTSGQKTKIPLSVTVTVPLVVTKMTPTTGPVGTAVHMYGTGFDPKDNWVTIVSTTGTEYYYTIENLAPKKSGSAQVLTFTFPSQLLDEAGDPVSTPPGDYLLWDYIPASGANSSAFHFTVTSTSSTTPKDMLDASTTPDTIATSTSATTTDPVAPDPISPEPIVIAPPISTSTPPVSTTTPPEDTNKHHKNKDTEAAS